MLRWTQRDGGAAEKMRFEPQDKLGRVDLVDASPILFLEPGYARDLREDMERWAAERPTPAG